MSHQRRVSVIIATYDSCDLLAETLRHLARQTLPTDDYEVIVGDDGSSDRTAEVVHSFADRMHIKYFFQEDRGFRVAAARNGAARLAAGSLLVILDTGSMVGPDFLAEHLAAHPADGNRRSVLGLSYGYNPEVPMPGVDELLGRMTPETVVQRFREMPDFNDVRGPYFAGCGQDLTKRLIPWKAFWTGNCSVRTDDFRRVGGFDEIFQGWGGEDMELGFRLQRAGLPIELAPAAWAVVAPHERDQGANFDDLYANMRRFLGKFPTPAVELGCAAMMQKGQFWQWEPFYAELLDWQRRVGGLDVRDEIAAALADVPAGEPVTIIGCGADLPATAAGATLVDFDERLLERAVRSGDHTGYHAVGLHTTLAGDSAGTVVITSRLAGLWGTWSTELLAEAGRIGRRTLVYAAASELSSEGKAA